jgi:hypothetical protein
LWVDAISINQADDVEKEQQVARMAAMNHGAARLRYSSILSHATPPHFNVSISNYKTMGDPDRGDDIIQLHTDPYWTYAWFA